MCEAASLICHLYSYLQKLLLADGRVLTFGRLCLCTGGKPKVIGSHPRIIGIRDTQTVKEFQELLRDSKKVVIVGNGGIATELVYELRNVEIVWVIKHSSISATFVDAGAAEFFLPSLQDTRPLDEGVSKRRKYTHSTQPSFSAETGTLGSALGPDWVTELDRRGGSGDRQVNIEYSSEVDSIIDAEPGSMHPIRVKLTTGKCIDCGMVVSATGVDPNTDLWMEADGSKLPVADDGGISVDDQMQTCKPGVYAAGDLCSAGWARSEHWFQMRLWTQARQLGAYAGRCMAAHAKGDRMELDFCFEMFSHVTNFFGYKVILLGRYNAQGMTPDEYEVLLRVDKGREFIKVVVRDDRMKGAILIGETDLEETFENLILNQTDIRDIKDDLLNPTLDVEDYFD